MRGGVANREREIAATHRSCDCLRQRTFGSADIQTAKSVGSETCFCATSMRRAARRLEAAPRLVRRVASRLSATSRPDGHESPLRGTRKLASRPSIARKGSRGVLERFRRRMGMSIRSSASFSTDNWLPGESGHAGTRDPTLAPPCSPCLCVSDSPIEPPRCSRISRSIFVPRREAWTAFVSRQRRVFVSGGRAQHQAVLPRTTADAGEAVRLQAPRRRRTRQSRLRDARTPGSWSAA